MVLGRLTFLCTIILYCVPLLGYAHADDTPLFSEETTSQKTTDLSVLPPWQRVLDFKEIAADKDNFSILMWRKLIDSLKHESKSEQLFKVNLWLNSFPYKQDNHIYGKSDHWSSPTEFLTHGGDCEDFAIIKYITLRELGFTAAELKIAIVYDVFSGTDHAFLLANNENEEFVLDNRDHIISSSHYKDRYKPYYVFNETELTTFDKPVIASTIRDAENSNVLPGNR